MARSWAISRSLSGVGSSGGRRGGSEKGEEWEGGWVRR